MPGQILLGLKGVRGDSGINTQNKEGLNLRWCEIKQVNRLCLNFTTSLKILENDPRWMESQQKPL